MRSIHLTIFLALLFVTVGCEPKTTVDEETSTEVASASPAENPDVDRESTAKARFEELNQGFETDIKNLEQRIENVSSQSDQQKLFEELNPVPNYVAGMLKLSNDYSDTKIAVSAALEALGKLKGAKRDPAMSLLIEKFASRVDFKKMSKSFLEEIPSPEIEKWIQNMLANASSEKIKGDVLLNLAEYVNRLVRYQVIFEDNPELYKRLNKDHQEYIYANRTAESYDQLGALLDEACEGRDDDFRRKAQALKVELTQLRIGQVAPDIEGKDLDGIPFKLSDYRGKVVMLDFWGHWCPPCRRMYPHEQFLASELKDEPFVLLGVNSDRDIDTARDAVQGEGLTWRHFWNGPQGMYGGIAEDWNVEGWPTIYLIDGDGKIRAKHIAYENLDRAIEKVLAEIGSEVTLDFEHTN